VRHNYYKKDGHFNFFMQFLILEIKVLILFIKEKSKEKYPLKADTV